LDPVSGRGSLHGRHCAARRVVFGGTEIGALGARPGRVPRRPGHCRARADHRRFSQPRQFGPAIFSGNLDFLWVYLLAPMVGAALATVVFKLLTRRRVLTGPRRPARGRLSGRLPAHVELRDPCRTRPYPAPAPRQARHGARGDGCLPSPAVPADGDGFSRCARDGPDWGY
jgi:hypothetical protein